MIKHAGSIQEVKANAFKALHDLAGFPKETRPAATDLLQYSESPLRNNLFVAWLLYQSHVGKQAYRLEDLLQDVRKLSKKVQFL